jgi:hypothetical protein
MALRNQIPVNHRWQHEEQHLIRAQIAIRHGYLSLVIPFRVIVLLELHQCSPKRALPEQNQF